MSMSTHIVGFKPADEKWKQMKAALDACAAAHVPAPQEVVDFFEGETPDPAGVEVSEKALRYAGAVREYKDDMREGFEVEIEQLPKDVKILRFYNSW